MGSQPDSYVLQRNTSATTRLNYQYYLWQDTFRFHLHPDIPQLAPDARIAEVATGSGIWLFDTAREVPSNISLTGLDISLDQIPGPRGSQMPNMSFQQWSFFDAPPEDLVGKFDVVHMRLVAVVVMDQDPEKILKNVKLLLKPGGYIQWEEHYTPDAQVLTAAGVVTTEFPGLTGMRDLLARPLNATDGSKLLGCRDWLLTLDSTMEKEGFENVRKIIYQDSAHMGTFYTDMYATTAEEFAELMLKRDPALAKQLTEMISKLHEEKLTGAWVSNPKAVFLGQRSLQQ
ncbi:hypothetical protein VHEMI02482 [[Torrubiella] hemipterigena]|uniref:Methyltransferase domain-containing protein n=1 Tax=[Torrubiella] hemipterigena TaxID=1531966 RepID=A0A0A1SVV3_9HYPO|nr:hypothetical protein VHEMI02482 [[Torrubiella] hemipterigena]